MDQIYCTVLSKDRLYQGIALYESMMRHIKQFVLYILFVDKESKRIIENMRYENILYSDVSEFENRYPDCRKGDKNIHEYCWMLKPFLIDYLFAAFKDLKRVTYLDADLYFFSSPDVVFFRQMNCSVLLSLHVYPDDYRNSWYPISYGKHNAGFISFKRDKNSKKCLKWWRARCRDWCYARIENGRYGDQGYLNLMPQLFNGVCDITTKGVNIAPWNYSSYQFSLKNKSVYVDNDPLIFFHFSGLRIFNDNKFGFLYEDRQKMIEIVHGVYLRKLKNIVIETKSVDRSFNGYCKLSFPPDCIRIIKLKR